MCEKSPIPQHNLGRQEPKGCRYIYGDPGFGDWHFCQRTIVEGGVAGDARHPPYCSHHHRICTIPINQKYMARYYGNFADYNVLLCGEDHNDGQRLPVDFILKLTPTGALSHD